MSILFSYKTTFTNQHIVKDVVAVMFHVIKVSFEVKFISYNNELLLTLLSIALGIVAASFLPLKQFEFTAIASNIFDADYIETGFVPMPPSNVLFGLRYNFK